MAGKGGIGTLGLILAVCTALAILQSTAALGGEEDIVEYVDEDFDELDGVDVNAQTESGSSSTDRDAQIRELEKQNRCHYTCNAGMDLGFFARTIICYPSTGEEISKGLRGSCCPVAGMRRCSQGREQVCRRTLTWENTGNDCGFKKCILKVRRKAKRDLKKFIDHQVKVCFFKLGSDALVEGGLSPRQGRHPRCCRQCANGKWARPICMYKKKTG